MSPNDARRRRSLRRAVPLAAVVVVAAVVAVVLVTRSGDDGGERPTPDPSQVAGPLTWMVDPSPFRLIFTRGDVAVTAQATGDDAGPTTRMSWRGDDGRFHTVTELRGERRTDDGTSYTVATDEPGRTATVDVRRTGGGLRVAWSLEPATGVTHVFEALTGDRAEHFLGSGERARYVDLRERVVPLRVAYNTAEHLSACDESTLPVPFFLSSRGYGVRLETSAVGRVAFPGAVDTYPAGCPRPDRNPPPVGYADDRTQLAVAADRLTYDLYAGTPAEVIRAYVDAAGHPKMPPPVQFGLVQSRDQIADAAQLLDDADQIQRRGIPLTAIRVDNPWELTPSGTNLGLRGACVGSFRFDPRRFPDPAGLVRTLHGRGLRFVVWDSPFVYGPDAVAGCPQPGYPDGSFVGAADRWNARALNVDFTAPGARAEYQRRLESLLALGVDGIVGDRGDEADFTGSRFAGGSGRLLHNLYPVDFATANVEVLQRMRGDDYFVAFRSGWAGSQSVLHGIWASDQEADWEGLREAVRMGLTAGASGFPTWGSDIGGYVPTAQLTPDLFVRWSALGALSPVMQVHGLGRNATFWTWGEPTVSRFRALATLHYELFPHLYSLAREATDTGMPVLRALGLQWPDWEEAWSHDLEFTVGRDLLAAPVTADAGPTAVWLPPGEWWDLFDGRLRSGPSVDRRVPPSPNFPLALRAGAAIAYDGRSPDVWAERWGVSDLGRPGRAGWLYAPGEGEGTASHPSGGRLRATTSEDRVTVELDGAPREAQVRILSAAPPSRVEIDGREVPVVESVEELRARPSGWVFTPGAVQGVTVKLSPSDGRSRVTLDVRRPPATPIAADDCAEIEPSDGFGGQGLDRCRWTSVVREDPDAMRVREGTLELDTQERDILALDNTDPRNLVLQRPPADDWSMAVTVDPAAFREPSQQGGLVAHGDDDAYVLLGARQEGLLLRSESNGRVDSLPVPWPADVPRDRPVHLRLTKAGDTYTAAVSADGRRWRDLGSRRNRTPVDIRVGIYAFGGAQRSPTTVPFDDFRFG